MWQLERDEEASNEQYLFVVTSGTPIQWSLRRDIGHYLPVCSERTARVVRTSIVRVNLRECHAQ